MTTRRSATTPTGMPPGDEDVGGGRAASRRSEGDRLKRASPRLQMGGPREVSSKKASPVVGHGKERDGTSRGGRLHEIDEDTAERETVVAEASAGARNDQVDKEVPQTPPSHRSLRPLEDGVSMHPEDSEATEEGEASGLEVSGMRTPTGLGHVGMGMGLPGGLDPMGMFFSPIRSPGAGVGSPAHQMSPFLAYCANLSPYTPQRNKFAPNAFNDFLNSQYRSPTPFGSADKLQLGLGGPLNIGGSGKSPKVEDFSLIGTITELNVEYKLARGESLRKKNDARRSNVSKGKGGAKGVGSVGKTQVLGEPGLEVEEVDRHGVEDRLAPWTVDPSAVGVASVASPSGGLGMDGKGFSRRALAFDSPMSDGLPFMGGAGTADDAASLGIEHSSLFDKSAREISENFWVGGSPLSSGKGASGSRGGGSGSKRMLGKELQLGLMSGGGSSSGGGGSNSLGSAKKAVGGGKKKSPREGGDDGEGCKRCSCKRSKCLKLYCECFAANQYCGGCGCLDCHNTSEYEALVNRTRDVIKIRNPTAFQPKVLEVFTADGLESADGDTPRSVIARHKKGCSCKRSHCLKKYCECFQEGVNCGDHCKCEGCKNSSFGCGPGDADSKQGIRLDTVKNKKLNRIMAQAQANEVQRAVVAGGGSALKRQRPDKQPMPVQQPVWA